MPSAPEMPDIRLNRRNNEDKLGRDIIDECRTQLMLKFRFLDLALWRMDLMPLRVDARYPLATNAKQVIYDPPRVITRFQESFEESVRDYLHLVMHCIFRHPYDKNHSDKDAWGLACDIIVENAVMDMCGTRFVSADDAARRQAISEMEMLIGPLFPNKLYGLIRGMLQTAEGQQFRGLGRGSLNEWRALFERDDHGAWPANNMSRSQDSDQDQDMFEEFLEDDADPEAQADAIRTEMLEEGESESSGGANESQSSDSDADSEVTDDEGESDDGAQAEVSDAAEPPDPDEAKDEKEWEEISKQIEMNLETFSKEWGEEAGSLIANLALANHKTVSYSDFLRRFMVVTEEMLLNMDEFDYIYYSYGMHLYGNMPLIEPLEYKETERVHDFAIAIDTSESVSGELVKRFIAYTFDMLKSSEEYASEVNIHIIQCDARVQSDTKIKRLKDVDKMVDGMQIRGFGGTDFRPVFDYIDMLRKRGELVDLKGLIYFTDGLGQFPEKPPDYDAAFVFVAEEGKKPPSVPPWAMKILIDETGIKHLRSKSRA